MCLTDLLYVLFTGTQPSISYANRNQASAGSREHLPVAVLSKQRSGSENALAHQACGHCWPCIMCCALPATAASLHNNRSVRQHCQAASARCSRSLSAVRAHQAIGMPGQNEKEAAAEAAKDNVIDKDIKLPPTLQLIPARHTKVESPIAATQALRAQGTDALTQAGGTDGTPGASWRGLPQRGRQAGVPYVWQAGIL